VRLLKWYIEEERIREKTVRRRHIQTAGDGERGEKQAEDRQIIETKSDS
jgi:hypothetical protein